MRDDADGFCVYTMLLTEEVPAVTRHRVLVLNSPNININIITDHHSDDDVAFVLLGAAA